MPKAAKSVSMPQNESISVSVRKIDNGYIICRSHDGPKGWKSSETFSATKPKLEIPTAKGKR